MPARWRLPAAAQVQRNFSAKALRGEVVFGTPPEVMLNGKPARLAPGARIRGARQPAADVGRAGRRQGWWCTTPPSSTAMLLDVWILTPGRGRAQALADAPTQEAQPGCSTRRQTWTKP